MSKKVYNKNNQANESVSKYKLLSAYGGPGSIVHTQYGSVIISCIEEWGFLKKIIEIHKEFTDKQTAEKEMHEKVSKDARLERNGNIGISNDHRLLESLQVRKELTNLMYLVLVPDIEVVSHSNKIKDNGEVIAIPSTYMPKVFADNSNNYKPYSNWYKDWVNRAENNDKYGEKFHPPKHIFNEEKGWTSNLKQDNIILLCEHGHISDFPWSKFLRWRKEEPLAIFEDAPVNLFEKQDCCNKPNIKITSNTGNASGFDGKWLKCSNCNRGISLKGLMSVKILCPGHLPWEVNTGDVQYHSGNRHNRNQDPPNENCNCKDGKGKPKPLKVALTTGNNIYYSRIISSIYLHSELFESEDSLEIIRLQEKKKQAVKNEEYGLAEKLNNKIKELELNQVGVEEEIPDSMKEMIFRYNEFKAFHKNEELLRKYPKNLKVKDVTENLNRDVNNNVDGKLAKYFKRILRVDNMKITSAQLDFSRVVPIDADAENAHPKNIFRSKNENVVVYPVVENFGEGIFFSFNDELIEDFSINSDVIENMKSQLSQLQKESNNFNKGAIDFANVMNWQLYLVHTFSHLIMRELEFRCGYPTASLSERIYVSNENDYKMYGCLIYTAEGAEGSMGGLIAQTRPQNLNNLIKSAIKRATICNSDPLCWESEGQGLFDLNFASCFSCSLVSETSCEHRNLYLDRKILVDSENGFFKEIIN
ncbi:DrmB family protein [Polaribacter aquimarinus]|uniref:MrfA-like Zn-binding domain-containing protein n=1 Tax=Polaribacter aquimarinus TaxID=2100726 RepID=A0A2U2JA68_9FLAO|nr:DrmB family protein [Polaribacter aquimarinus]PWG05215.1 hypothetical protein DIS07_08185 [Polaribacter aquimarinus]